MLCRGCAVQGVLCAVSLGKWAGARAAQFDGSARWGCVAVPTCHMSSTCHPAAVHPCLPCLRHQPQPLSALQPCLPCLCHHLLPALLSLCACTPPLQLIHANMLDTSVMFPHPKGPPYKSALRVLASRHLLRTIQRGGRQACAWGS